MQYAHISEEIKTFSLGWVRNMANEMLKMAETVGKGSLIVTIIALSISIPHQIGFLLGQAPLLWNTWQNWIASITDIAGAAGIPLATDIMIFNCIKTISARAIQISSRIWALVILCGPVSVSATMNYLAPAPEVFRIAFVVGVLYIPLGESLRTLSQRPDFRKVVKSQVEILQQTEEPPAPKERRPRAKNKTERIKRLWEDNPGMPAKEIAKLAGDVHVNHVYSVIRALKKAQMEGLVEAVA
jgi:hypothetical protein